MTATLAPGLARKVKKVLSIKSDAPELLNALDTLSEVYDSNTSSNRRRLRAIIEKKSVTTNLAFLESTQEVMKMLDHVQLNLNELSRCCNSISSTLSSSKSSTAALLERTEGLTSELDASLRKSQLIETFLEQYQLSADEVSALTGEELNERFFAALERVHVIHSNCRTLLRSHHQRAGLELMDSMAEYQEAAYERLCRFVQAQCRTLVDVDVPDVNPLLQQAAHALRERPVLFRYCSEEVATARHNAVFQNFVAALTQGGPGGMPRPIEIHAHDPLRYISDMFAWVHQALASEKELLVSLFGNDGAAEAGNGVPAKPVAEGPEEGRSAVEMPETTALIDKVFEGICRPLKVRIEQVLMSNPSMLLCFQILQLLSFYVSTLTQLAGGETHLTRTVMQVRDMAAMCFHEQLKNKADKVLRYPPVPPRDLSCPPEISDLIRQLLEIVEANESSMTDAGSSEAAQSFDAIVGAVIDPLVQVCRKSADILLSSSNLDAEDSSSAAAPSALKRASSEGKSKAICPNAHLVFLINCLVAIHTPLSLHRSCLPRARLLAEEIDKQVAGLVESESRRILAQCGLLEVADRVQTYLSDGATASGPPMAADSALTLPSLVEKLRAMFVAVAAPDAVPDYEQLVAPRLRVEVAKRVSAVLAGQYSMVYNAVADEANGYAQYGGISAIKNTPVQLQTVLGLSERPL